MVYGVFIIKEVFWIVYYVYMICGGWLSFDDFMFGLL